MTLKTISKFQLTVRIAQRWVTQFRDNGMNLCCAFGFQCDQSRQEYNLIAWAEDPTPVNTITWADEHFIAAGKRGVEDGTTATPNTTAMKVTSNDNFILNKNWSATLQQISDDSRREGEGWQPKFHFSIQTPATAMLFKRMRGKFVMPVYLLSMGKSPLIPGQYSVEPTGNLALFFMARDESTQLEQIRTTPLIFNYLQMKTAGASFDENGTWHVETGQDRDADGRADPQDWTRAAGSVGT